MCNAFFVFVGAPVIEVTFVVDGSRLGEIVNRIDDGACLGVAVVKGLEIFFGPVCPVHVVKWLCMPQLGLDLLMEKGDAVLGFVVLLEQVGCLDLKVLEKFVGGGLWPFHEVQEVYCMSGRSRWTRLWATIWPMDWGLHLVLTTRHCLGRRSGFPL